MTHANARRPRERGQWRQASKEYSRRAAKVNIAFLSGFSGKAVRFNFAWFDCYRIGNVLIQPLLPEGDFLFNVLSLLQLQPGSSTTGQCNQHIWSCGYLLN